jgi:hypothetical protein
MTSIPVAPAACKPPSLLSQDLSHWPLDLAAIEWVQGVPLTPDQLDASFPAGVGDDLAWQVVCIGREPGLYLSA